MRAGRLICTLHYELEIDAGTLPVVLSLIDQLYDTRQRLLSLTAAVTAQNQNVQAAIIAAMEPLVNAGLRRGGSPIARREPGFRVSLEPGYAR